MHDKSNREINSIYIHQGLYQDATTGPSSILLTTEDVINGLYVIDSNGGDMTCPTGSDICNDLPENVRRNDITFRFTLVNNHIANVNLLSNTGLTFHPAGNMVIVKDRSYEIIFRVIDVSLGLVDVYRMGFT